MTFFFFGLDSSLFYPELFLYHLAFITPFVQLAVTLHYYWFDIHWRYLCPRTLSPLSVFDSYSIFPLLPPCVYEGRNNSAMSEDLDIFYRLKVVNCAGVRM